MNRSDRRRRVSMCCPHRESSPGDSMETCILEGLLGYNMDLPAAQEMAVVQESTQLQGAGANLEDSRQDIDRCKRSQKWRGSGGWCQARLLLFPVVLTARSPLPPELSRKTVG